MAVFCWNSGGGIGWWLGTTCPQALEVSKALQAKHLGR